MKREKHNFQLGDLPTRPILAWWLRWKRAARVDVPTTARPRRTVGYEERRGVKGRKSKQPKLGEFPVSHCRIEWDEDRKPYRLGEAEAEALTGRGEHRSVDNRISFLQLPLSLQ